MKKEVSIALVSIFLWLIVTFDLFLWIYGANNNWIVPLNINVIGEGLSELIALILIVVFSGYFIIKYIRDITK